MRFTWGRAIWIQWNPLILPSHLLCMRCTRFPQQVAAREVGLCAGEQGVGCYILNECSAERFIFTYFPPLYHRWREGAAARGCSSGETQSKGFVTYTNLCTLNHILYTQAQVKVKTKKSKNENFLFPALYVTDQSHILLWNPV